MDQSLLQINTPPILLSQTGTPPISGRRIITGHRYQTPGSELRENARESVDIVLNESAQLKEQLGLPGIWTCPMWATTSFPSMSDPEARVEDGAKLAGNGLVVPGGSNLRMTALEPFTTVGLHRSASVDYNIVTRGLVYLVTPSEDGLNETLCRQGDTVVQRGTLHGWRTAEEGATWVTVILEAHPVHINGKALPDIDL